MKRPVPLGRLLVDTGLLTEAQLNEALEVQRTDRRRLGELLVERKYVHPIDLAQVLSHQLSCPWVSLAHAELDPEVLALLPKEMALRHVVLPVHLRVTKAGRALYLATDDPTDANAISACADAAGIAVRPMVAVLGELRAALLRIYGRDVSTAVTEPPPSSRAKPPPLPAKKEPPVVVQAPVSERRPLASVLALNAPEGFLKQCRAALQSLSATLVDGAIMRATELVREHRPFAIVVTDDVYAFDRAALNRLALENDAHLVVWSEDVDSKHLTPLLAGAMERAKRISK